MADWQQYEREIEDQFRAAYPTARITFNAQLPGKFSKVERQIDLLIEEQASDFSLRIIVDAKCRGRKIDVGEVEAFLGMMRDVEAHVGMMVALEGYTQAAINRAHYDDLDAILDVLNLDELKEWQGEVGIPYSGGNGVSIAAPFGWVVDGTRRKGMLASLYQRGLSYEEALRSNEFMYVNFWSKDDPDIRTLEALLQFQKSYLMEGSPTAEITFMDGEANQFSGAKTLIRCCKNKYAVPEYTGFVEFEKFFFMCVLFTPGVLERKNLRKLRSILRNAIPMNVTKDNTALIKAAEEKLRTPLPDPEKAKLRSEIGHLFSDMGKLEDARRNLEESLTLVSGEYWTLRQLIPVLLKLEDKDSALKRMGEVMRLDPHNPTVFDDCIFYARGSCVSFSELLILLEVLRTERADDDLVQANCDFYSGKLLMAVEPQAARKRLVAAQRSFRKVFPRKHQVFSVINKVLRAGKPG